jgi:hypothetical protein
MSLSLARPTSLGTLESSVSRAPSDDLTVHEYLEARFVEFIPFLQSLVGAQRPFAEPYTCYLQWQVGLHICYELGLHFSAQSLNTVFSHIILHHADEEITITTTHIRAFITRHRQVPGTFNNNKSKVSRCIRLYQVMGKPTFQKPDALVTDNLHRYDIFMAIFRDMLQFQGKEVLKISVEPRPRVLSGAQATAQTVNWAILDGSMSYFLSFPEIEAAYREACKLADIY